VQLNEIPKVSMSKENIEITPPKGFKDFLPPEQIIRNKIRTEIVAVFESHGFDPLETPAIEYQDVLTAKYAGGSEIVKQIYKVSDRAGRKLALKYDQTVPLSRLYAANPGLGKPFKRYQIDRAWRDEFGTRDREFWQCDVDTLGTSSMLADFEFLEIYQEIFRRFDLPVILKLNNRKLLNGILEQAGIEEAKRSGALLSLDKLEKIGRDKVIVDAEERGVTRNQMEKVFAVLNLVQGDTNEQRLERIASSIDIDNQEGQEGIDELRLLLKYADASQISGLVFTPTLARGLEYYTGPIFEVFLKSGKVKGSLCGGGRYDNIIGQFIGKGETIPAVGTTVGLSRIYDALIAERKVIPEKTLLKVLVIPVGKEDLYSLESLRIASLLREQTGLSVSVDVGGNNIKQSLKYANKKGVPYVVMVGEDELREKKPTLKIMETGEQTGLSLEELVSKLRALGK